MSKSLCLSYVLWMVGGPLGLHHFYLRRDKQAFVWWTTFGGWVIGWLRDFFRLPVYVYEADIDEEQNGTDEMQMKRPATLSIERCFGAVALGSFYGILLRILIPEELVKDNWILWLMARLLAPIGVSLGVYLVLNIGREVSSFSSALRGASIVLPFTFISDESYMMYMAIASVISVRYHGVHYVSSPRRHPSLWKRCAAFSTGASIYCAVWVVILLFNVSVTSETGETVPLKTAAYNFFHSEAWRETRSTSWYLYQFWAEHGWEDMFTEMKRKFDTSGIGHAQEVLEFTRWMSEEEMTRQYRSLSRKWHPDKYKDLEEKEFAQKRFIEIQSAWEKISSLKAKRELKNRQSRRDEL